MSCRMGHFGRVPSEHGRPHVHPASRKHSEARCNQWKHHRLKKKTDAALQAAQTVLALFSEATRREMLAQSERARQEIHSRATSLQREVSSREEELVALQWGKRGIWG